uniref:Nose resistant-to-fluoxetine protein N-terminal domain-containing protein n=2 Tax=Clytia hemisphaerica TaxID=252671 RepID=A0A7M5UX50_9CNID
MRMFGKLLTITTILAMIRVSNTQFPDLGDQFPKLSMECNVQLYKHGKPIFDLMMRTSNQTAGGGQNIMKTLLLTPLGKMLDSWGKLPARVFNLHTNWMGAYDECKSMQFTKYCSSNMKIYNMLDGVYGSCVPKGCSDNDTHEILNFISKKYLNNYLTFPDSGKISWIFGSPTYCEKPVSYNNGFYVTLVLSSIILVLCLLGSFVDGFVEPVKILKTRREANGIENKGLENDDEKDAKSIPMKSLSGDGIMNNNEEEEVKKKEDFEEKKMNHEEEETTKTVTIEIDADPLLLKILRCFSLQRNTCAIMGTEQPKGAIRSVHGIRALSMFWVIIGHVFLWSQGVPNDNTLVAMSKLATEWSYQVINNSFVSVDSFFLLSGLLVSYLSWKRMDKTNGKINLPMFYIHRFLRLTPLYMFVILLWNNIFPYTIFGPLAPRYQTENHFKACNKYWWTNLLYINNFWPENFTSGCLDWSWYLANDMQFYIVAPVILYVMYKVEQKFKHSKYRIIAVSSVIIILCTICVIINAAMVGGYDYPSLLINGNIPGNPRQKSYQKNHDKIYTKPYTRINPYLVGILVGYLLARKDQIKRTLIYIFLWLVAFGLGYAVVYGPYVEAYKELLDYLSNGSNVMYGAFHRLVWAIAVGWIVYACQNGFGGYINSFLSWGAWVPISRLTFAAYLVHPLVIFFFYGISERPYHYQDNMIVYNMFSNIFWAYGCAFILAVTVEYPSMQLEKLLIS